MGITMNKEYQTKVVNLATSIKQYKADKKKGWRIVQLKRGRKVIEIL